MSSQEEPAIPVALREARDIVAEQLERLRALAERERRGGACAQSPRSVRLNANSMR